MVMTMLLLLLMTTTRLLSGPLMHNEVFCSQANQENVAIDVCLLLCRWLGDEEW